MNNLHLIEKIKLFLEEDIGPGDITSEALFQNGWPAKALFIAKSDFTIAGLEIAELVFETQNHEIHCDILLPDGSKALPGDKLLKISGPAQDLLKAERVALNICQRLCGIASLTAAFVEKTKGLPVRIVDTRKTNPGLRTFEKYAVRVGGGYNHRFNLADAVLIKENHIKACGSIHEAITKTRKYAPHTMKIEVEAERLDQVEECLAAGADIIMLDNMSLAEMRKAVELVQGKALIEASGGVTLDNVRDIAETGVDIISIGALTHSAPASDISMLIVD
ncbi:MAG: carboxylating nicotinate-nucleotide diphosphorylase [Proteobacteria bacterium]|nr:carboxylating nicotinate-nucleotide diphosphorylase [Pseudomonadota bacterium]